MFRMQGLCFGSRGSGVRIPPPRPFQAIDISSDIAGSGHASAFSGHSTVVDFVAMPTLWGILVISKWELHMG